LTLFDTSLKKYSWPVKYCQGETLVWDNLSDQKKHDITRTCPYRTERVRGFSQNYPIFIRKWKQPKK